VPRIGSKRPMIILVCEHCGGSFERERSQHDHRVKRGCLRIFCSLKCAGANKKLAITDSEKKASKADYDREYRSKNLDLIKAKKAEHYQKTADREKEREIRKKRMPLHVEYCRRPEYKEKKSKYDRQLRAKAYGEFAEAYLTLLQIDKEIEQRMTSYEIRMLNGTQNKKQERQRDYARTHSYELENSTLGDIERD